jgi:hypothetical protein
MKKDRSPHPKRTPRVRELENRFVIWSFFQLEGALKSLFGHIVIRYRIRNTGAAIEDTLGEKLANALE